MESKKTIFRAIASVMLLIPMAALAQNSSVNTFSPYSIYGLGDLSTVGTSSMRAMGGTGTAYRDMKINPYSSSINLLNPASYSSIPQRSVMFEFGLEGNNRYMKQGDKKSSNNSFNVKEVALLVPLAKNVGFAASLTPFSSVGYRMQRTETGREIAGDFVDVTHKFVGEGDYTQFKAGIGWQPIKNLSVGAEMLYLKGSTDRTFNIDITSAPNTGNYSNSLARQTERISKVFGIFGAQYTVFRNVEKNTVKDALTVGATYRMGGNLNPKIRRVVPLDDYDLNILNDNQYTNKALKLADEVSVGAFYYTGKMSVGIDYVFQNWGGKNSFKATGVDFTNTNTIKAGIEYTPNFFDVRRPLKRITYRFGVRYGDNYVKFNGQKINDKAVTMGVSIPTKYMGRSKIDLGLEYGQRGTTRHNLIKEEYFKVAVGLRLFGEDYWFVKRKYD